MRTKIYKTIAEKPPEDLARGWLRYEAIRKLNPKQFGELWEKNIRTGVPFDKEVDQLLQNPEGLMEEHPGNQDKENPPAERLAEFAESFYQSGFLDIIPEANNSGYCISLNDEVGNTIDELVFKDEQTATRYIDWLARNAEEIQAIKSKRF